MILVFGSINTDLVARVREIPRPGETALAPGYEVLPGGKGANQAVAAARARRDGGMPVRMAGAVGADAFGRAARADLLAAGVGADDVAEVALPTGCAFITVSEHGENAITVAAGANRLAAAPAMPASLRVLILQMEVPAPASLDAARRAREAGASVILNLAPAPGPEDAPFLADLLAAATHLVANEHEAVAALARLGEAVDDPVRAMRRLGALGGCVGIVTLGAAGAVAFGADGREWRAPATPVAPVDTTGAGDTFVGVLAAGLADGIPLPAAMGRACRAASLACLAPGARAGMPEASSIDG